MNGRIRIIRHASVTAVIRTKSATGQSRMIRSTRIVQNGTSIEDARKAALKAAFKAGLGSARRAPSRTLLRLVDDAVFGVDHGPIVCRGSRRRVALRLQADPRHGPDLLALAVPSKPRLV